MIFSLVKYAHPSQTRIQHPNHTFRHLIPPSLLASRLLAELKPLSQVSTESPLVSLPHSFQIFLFPYRYSNGQETPREGREPISNMAVVYGILFPSISLGTYEPPICRVYLRDIGGKQISCFRCSPINSLQSLF